MLFKIYNMSKLNYTSILSFAEGNPMKIDLSILPGRKSAGSIKSGRDVAAKMNTPSKPSAPSICVKS